MGYELLYSARVVACRYDNELDDMPAAIEGRPDAPVSIEDQVIALLRWENNLYPNWWDDTDDFLWRTSVFSGRWVGVNGLIGPHNQDGEYIVSNVQAVMTASMHAARSSHIA